MAGRPPFDVQARRIAWRIIREEGFTALPIDPRRIMEAHHIGLWDYRRFASLANRTPEDIAADYDEDGFLFPLETRAGLEYRIVHNACKPPERINWTLMHELSHYYLGHVKGPGDILKRSHRHKCELDVEADSLAARIFCPTVILHMCGVESPAEIQRLCGVSYRAAELRWHHLCKARHYNKFLTYPEERSIVDQFTPFICRYLCQKNYHD